VVWWCGGVVVWWCGGVVVWWCGGVVVWWCGGVLFKEEKTKRTRKSENKIGLLPEGGLGTKPKTPQTALAGPGVKHHRPPCSFEHQGSFLFQELVFQENEPFLLKHQ
jgi:hypothetical protein